MTFSEVAAAILVATLCLACGRGPVAEEQAPRGSAAPVEVTFRPISDANGSVDVVEGNVDATPRDEELERQLHLLGSEHGYGVDQAEDWLVAHPDRSRPALAAILRADEQGFHIHRVLRVVGRIGHPDDVELLRLRLLTGKQSDTWDAANALRMHPAASAMDALLDGSKSSDANIVSKSVNAMGERRDERARPAIEALIDHDDRSVRSSVIYALQTLGVEPSRALLEARRKVERDAHVKKVLAEVLGKGGGTK